MVAFKLESQIHRPKQLSFFSDPTVKIKHLFLDLFCGAGGTTTGLEMAQSMGEDLCEVIACVNHDKNAILSHKANHPKAIHLTEDIRSAAIEPLYTALQNRKMQLEQKGYKVFIHIWASAECTNLSKAKGGMSRNADSRTLAVHLYRYVEKIDPDYLWLENVVEFLENGPLQVKVIEKNLKKGILHSYCPLDVVRDKKNKKKIIGYAPVWVPVKERKGEYYRDWVNQIQKFGYDYQYRKLNSADYGEYTSRIRYFGQFSKEGLPIAWPDQTHCRQPLKSKSTFHLKKWLPVKDCLDFSVEGESIFDRPEPLCDNTLIRILKGLRKHVAPGLVDKFIMKYYSNGGQWSTIEAPSGTLPTKDRMSLIECVYQKSQTSKMYWIDKQYSGQNNHQSTERPAGAILVNDKHSLTEAHFIVNNYSGGGQTSSISDPAAAVTTVPKGNVVKYWIMNSNFMNAGSSVEDPAPGILACRKHHYIMNPAYNANLSSTDQPCCTIVARQDKVPLYFLAIEYGQVAIGVYETDSPTMVAIKSFMAAAGIVDIKMRLFLIKELLKIQGFPESYQLVGTKTDMKKFIGNSVTPKIPKALIESLHQELQMYLRACA